MYHPRGIACGARFTVSEAMGGPAPAFVAGSGDITMSRIVHEQQYA